MLLVQEILSEVRDVDHFDDESETFRIERLPGHWEIKNIAYHMILLLEEGFLARTSTEEESEGPGAAWAGGIAAQHGSGLRLTWKGHDLLDDLREGSASQF